MKRPGQGGLSARFDPAALKGPGFVHLLLSYGFSFNQKVPGSPQIAVSSRSPGLNAPSFTSRRRKMASPLTLDQRGCDCLPMEASWVISPALSPSLGPGGCPVLADCWDPGRSLAWSHVHVEGAGRRRHHAHRFRRPEATGLETSLNEFVRVCVDVPSLPPSGLARLQALWAPFPPIFSGNSGE